MNKETRNLLKLRAVSIASEPEMIRDSSSDIELIEFKLSSDIYGIESMFVREVYPLKDFTPLPGVPLYILGIMNVRGQILPVVDLKKLFNLPNKGIGELNKVIILHDEQMEFGILADEVECTKVIYREDLLPVPSVIRGTGKKYLKGFTKDNMIILSGEHLLRDKSIIINDVVTS